MQIFINNGMTENPNAFELCMRAENVHLPASGYMGVTGATGGLAGIVNYGIKFRIYSE